MSRHGEITLPFGTEERLFRLGLAEIRKIEERCAAGVPELMSRVSPLVRALGAKLSFAQIVAGGFLGTWRIDDAREPILQGLIGGGMGSTEAGVLVRSLFDEKLSFEFATTAYAIMEQAWFSPPEDLPEVGETRAATGKPRRRSRVAGRASRA